MQLRFLGWTCAGCLLVMMSGCQFDGSLDGVLDFKDGYKGGDIPKHGHDACNHEMHGRCDAGTPADTGLPDDGTTPDADSGVTLLFETDIEDSCNRTVRYETWNIRRSTGEYVNNPICHWAFNDGTTEDSCTGTHTFACAGERRAQVTVTDPETGATQTDTSRPLRVVDRLALFIDAVAPPCGLSIHLTGTWTGGYSRGRIQWQVEPSENVVSPPIYDLVGNDINVVLSAPGAYSIGAYIEQEHPYGPICEARAQTQVNVVACDAESPDAADSLTPTTSN